MKGLYEHSLDFNPGVLYALLHDDKAIDNHIAKIGKEIDLVMITERMEESSMFFLLADVLADGRHRDF